MNKLKIISLTASLVLAITFTISCEDKEKDKPATAAETASTAEAAPPPTEAAKAENSDKPSAEAPSAATPAPKKVTFTDPRDGKKYKSVKIGEQVWMAENLNFAAKGSKCYDNKPENCEKYGRLYVWGTAMEACPKGWHLPSDDEWAELMDFLASNKEDVRYEEDDETGQKYLLNAEKYLRSKSGWKNENDNGTDDFGFSALPGGRGHSDGNFDSVGDYGNWWSATESGSSGAYYRFMLYDYNGRGSIDSGFYSDKSYLYSVRCLQD